MLSQADNQIVTLSARSPLNTLSGCSILPKNDVKPILNLTPTTEPPILETTQIYDDESFSTQTSFDKYLKRTTILPKLSTNRSGKTFENFTAEPSVFSESLENFNDTDTNIETEVFNKSAMAGDERSHNGGGLLFKHDVGLENELENSTEYKLDVEELFETQTQDKLLREDEDLESRRQRRSESWPFHRTRETYIVRCHNAGTFISSRERWWYIAISNCGSNKGLDVTYRFKMTNGKAGDFWHEHFSADERCMSTLNNKLIFTTGV